MSESTPETPPDSSRTLDLRVPEMDCPTCAGKVTNSVERLEGIDEIDPRVTSGRLLVTYNSSVTSERAIRERVEAAGYAVESAATELTLSVPGMDCASCASKVENALADTEASVRSRPNRHRAESQYRRRMPTATP